MINDRLNSLSKSMEVFDESTVFYQNIFKKTADSHINSNIPIRLISLVDVDKGKLFSTTHLSMLQLI